MQPTNADNSGYLLNNIYLLIFINIYLLKFIAPFGIKTFWLSFFVHPRKLLNICKCCLYGIINSPQPSTNADN